MPSRKHFVTLPWGTRVRPKKVDAVDVGRVGLHDDPVFHFVEVHVKGRVLLSRPCDSRDEAEKLRDEVSGLIERATPSPSDGVRVIDRADVNDEETCSKCECPGVVRTVAGWACAGCGLPLDINQEPVTADDREREKVSLVKKVLDAVTSAGPWGRTPEELADEIGEDVDIVNQALNALEHLEAICSSNVMGRRAAYRTVPSR